MSQQQVVQIDDGVIRKDGGGWTGENTNWKIRMILHEKVEEDAASSPHPPVPDVEMVKNGCLESVHGLWCQSEPLSAAVDVVCRRLCSPLVWRCYRW